MLAPEPGTEIDGFRLGERMHVGSMATIYRLEGPRGPLPLIMKIPRLRAGGQAALTDFGLSCHRHLPDRLAAEFHTPVGNWVYMAPEQIAGERCDPRSDLFALGALLYELATGKRAFGTPSTVAQLRRRLYRDPPPPRSLVAATPPWLQEVILHCLEIDAGARPSSAAQVAFDLANPGQVALTERAVQSARAGIIKRGRRWLKARNFTPSAPPPPATDVAPLPVIVVAIATYETDEPFFEALRAATRRRVAADGGCRVACMTVVPPAAALSDDTQTSR